MEVREAEYVSKRERSYSVETSWRNMLEDVRDMGRTALSEMYVIRRGVGAEHQGVFVATVGYASGAWFDGRMDNRSKGVARLRSGQRFKDTQLCLRRERV